MDSLLQQAIDIVNESSEESDTQSETELILEQSLPSYGCKHYLRRVELYGKCCGEFFKCRLCHDEIKKHTFDRFTVDQIRCTECKTVQSVSNECINCKIVFGKYFCPICRLYDDTDKKQFHCDKCGLCRINSDKLIHCDKCKICVCQTPADVHKCIDDIGNSDCPFCYENLKNTVSPYFKVKCGHMSHVNCFNAYLKQDYRCPICQKSIIEDMTSINQQIALTVMINPMPEEYKKIIKVYCIECEKNSETDFHFVANKCGLCGSYNTKRI
jgi:RING finger/CHY zinc finger protein 1